ncbi:MAG: hypothetical protein ACRDVP_10185, partial [Acidimicrobiales bacterium]
LAAGVGTATALTSAGATNHRKPPAACVEAIKDYQQLIKDLEPVITTAGNADDLIGKAAEAGSTHTTAALVAITAKMHTIDTTNELAGAEFGLLAPRAVATARMCER